MIKHMFHLLADTFVSTIITNWKASWSCPSLLRLVSGDGYYFIFTRFRYVLLLQLYLQDLDMHTFAAKMRV